MEILKNIGILLLVIVVILAIGFACVLIIINLTGRSAEWLNKKGSACLHPSLRVDLNNPDTWRCCECNACITESDIKQFEINQLEVHDHERVS